MCHRTVPAYRVGYCTRGCSGSAESVHAHARLSAPLLLALKAARERSLLGRTPRPPVRAADEQAHCSDGVLELQRCTRRVEARDRVEAPAGMTAPQDRVAARPAR